MYVSASVVGSDRPLQESIWESQLLDKTLHLLIHSTECHSAMVSALKYSSMALFSTPRCITLSVP